MTKKKKARDDDRAVWRNRITGYGSINPEDLLANPLNYRIHPKAQQDALAGTLNSIGWIQDVIVNASTGFVLDGHLRVALALRTNQPGIPVKYVELTPEEEALALATLDPLTNMAGTDAAKLDELRKEQTQALWWSAFERMSAVMCPGAAVYCFMPQGGDQMMMMMMGVGIEPRHELIWLKNNHVLGRVDYAYKHEPILYAWKDGGHKFYGDFQTSVLEYPKPQLSDMHPTTKPLALVERLIGNSSRPAGVVYDCFLGSGTTLVACENLSRQCRAVELSPGYVAVALERYAAAFGIEAELVV